MATQPVPRLVRNSPQVSTVDAVELVKFLNYLNGKAVNVETKYVTVQQTLNTTQQNVTNLQNTTTVVQADLSTVNTDLANLTARIAIVEAKPNYVTGPVDFGSKIQPKTDAQVWFAMPSIKATSIINVEVLADATTDHGVLEAQYEGLTAKVFGLVAGTGFYVNVHSPLASFGQYLVRCSWV